MDQEPAPPISVKSVDHRSPAEVPIGNRLLAMSLDLAVFAVLATEVWAAWRFLVPDEGPFPKTRAAFFLRDGHEFAKAVGPWSFVTREAGPMALFFVFGAFVLGTRFLPGHRLFAAKIERKDGGVPAYRDLVAREFVRTFSLLPLPGIFAMSVLALFAFGTGRGAELLVGFAVFGSLTGFVEVCGLLALGWNVWAFAFGRELLHDRLAGTILVRDARSKSRPIRVLRGVVDLVSGPLLFLVVYVLSMLVWSRIC